METIDMVLIGSICNGEHEYQYISLQSFYNNILPLGWFLVSMPKKI